MAVDRRKTRRGSRSEVVPSDGARRARNLRRPPGAPEQADQTLPDSDPQLEQMRRRVGELLATTDLAERARRAYEVEDGAGQADGDAQTAFAQKLTPIRR